MRNSRDLVRLYSASGEIIRSITLVQARRMVLDDVAVPVYRRGGGELPGWRGNRWSDWPAVRMISPQKPPRESPTSLNANDSHLVAGENCSNFGATRAAEIRVQQWPLVNESCHGAKAPMVCAACK